MYTISKWQIASTVCIGGTIFNVASLHSLRDYISSLASSLGDSFPNLHQCFLSSCIPKNPHPKESNTITFQTRRSRDMCLYFMSNHVCLIPDLSGISICLNTAPLAGLPYHKKAILVADLILIRADSVAWQPRSKQKPEGIKLYQGSWTMALMLRCFHWGDNMTTGKTYF